MERKLLIGLIQEGMRFPRGKHRVWFSRCFEITVHPGKVVEVDEYEGLSEENTQTGLRAGNEAGAKGRMFHVGRSILQLQRNRICEEAGTGWKDFTHHRPAALRQAAAYNGGLKS